MAHTGWFVNNRLLCTVEELERSKMEAPTELLSQEGAPGSMEDVLLLVLSTEEARGFSDLFHL